MEIVEREGKERGRGEEKGEKEVREKKVKGER